MSDDFEAELRNIYFQEAAENLEESEAGYLIFNKDIRIEIIEKSFRLAHNLKGSSKAVGFIEVSDLLHHIEGILLGLKNKTIICNQNISNVLLEGNDKVKEIISHLKDDPKYKSDYSILLNKINEIKINNGIEIKSILPKPEANKESGDIKLNIEAKENHTPPIAHITYQPKYAEIQSQKATTPLAQQEPNENKPSPLCLENNIKSIHGKKDVTDEYIRIPLERISKLQNYIGEMVILESILRENLKSETSPSIKNIFRQLDKNTKVVQETVMNLRLVPIKPVFQKLARTARDISGQLNKDIQLEFIGEEIEIDKFILDQISDPLMHMIRNAIDHGIEDVETRIAKKKQGVGKIIVQAQQESGSLVITIEDDGKGLNSKFLLEKARSKGIIDANLNLSDEQCYQLIFASGFSTKSEATDISGRGVGMDVVRTNIENLNGHIQIKSEIDKGTVFKISVPISIGILSAFVVEVSEQKFIIPLHKVKETINLKNSVRKLIPGMGHIVILRNEEIPIYDLAIGLNLAKHKDSIIDEKVIIIIEDKNQKIGVILDRIINIQSVVTKSIGQELRCNSGIIGSVILGNGAAVPILEIFSLVQSEAFVQNIERTLNKVMI